MHLCLDDSGLYIKKIFTKREMVNCRTFYCLLVLTMNSVTTGARELNGTSLISLTTHNAKGECERSRLGIVRSGENGVFKG